MSARRSVAVGFVAALVLWLSAAAAAGAAQNEVKPGTASGASVAQTGWWWRANETPADTGGVAAPPETPAPHVPEGALPSSAAAGDPEKVSALGFTLKYGPGATVQSFLLSLRESGEPGTNVNADGATTKVLACPITEAFWIGGAAGKWSSVPEYDCDAGVPGERSSAGVWTFDLTSMAATWLAKGSTQPAAVALVEDVAAPESFQVAFDGTKKGVGLKLVASGGAVPTPPPPVSGSIGTGDSGAGSSGAGSSGSLGSGVPADAGDLSGGAPVTGDAPTAAEPAGAGDTPQVAAGQTGPATQLVGLFEDLPGGALFLLPIVLGMAYLIMLALGPNGEPALASGRHGVGRVLDRMRAARAKEDV